jgi:hypothetical protein
MTASEACIPGAVYIMPQPWVSVVYNYLITVIQVIMTVAYREVSTVHPNIIIKVYILMCWHIIISINIGHIIVVCVIVANRAPGWLAANIYTQAYAYLGSGGFNGKAAK